MTRSRIRWWLHHCPHRLPGSQPGSHRLLVLGHSTRCPCSTVVTDSVRTVASSASESDAEIVEWCHVRDGGGEERRDSREAPDATLSCHNLNKGHTTHCQSHTRGATLHGAVTSRRSSRYVPMITCAFKRDPTCTRCMRGSAERQRCSALQHPPTKVSPPDEYACLFA